MVISIKPPIHEATLLPAPVACSNVAACMMQCCVVACCWKLMLTFRLQFYFVAGNCFQQQCCLVCGGLKHNFRHNWYAHVHVQLLPSCHVYTHMCINSTCTKCMCTSKNWLRVKGLCIVDSFIYIYMHFGVQVL